MKRKNKIKSTVNDLDTQRNLKFGETMKISNISENHTNLMVDKQDGI